MKATMVTSLRIIYEQQLISLKQEANDVAAGVSRLSDKALLSAINYYLHYFNCETWTPEELMSIEERLNQETKVRIY